MMQRFSILLILALLFLCSEMLVGFSPICPPATVSGTSGYIKSPNFPHNYSNELDCSTVISVEQGKLVQLIFYAFETELGADSKFSASLV
jgi:hypothetical protein